MLAEDSHRPKVLSFLPALDSAECFFKLYYAGDSPYAGRREAFPPPNNQMKVFRSTQNAQTVGMAPSNQARDISA